MSEPIEKVSLLNLETKEEEVTLQKYGYSFIKKIGEGAFGKVFQVIYDDKGRRDIYLACKIVDTSSASEEFATKFFPRELYAIRLVSHPFLVKVHSILQLNDRYYIFMQFCDNGDVFNFIEKNGALKESQSRTWFNQLCIGMDYLHKLKLCHRDLKCENLLLTSAFNIKISDFGFSREFNKRTKSKSYCGTVSYAPPEIIRGIKYVPWRADIWSMGVILFVMLNKSLPFDDSNPRSMYMKQVAHEWEFRRTVKARTTADCQQVVTMLLEPIPDKRPSVKELLQLYWVKNLSPI